MKYTLIALLSLFIFACQSEQSSTEENTQEEEMTASTDMWSIFGDTIDTENINSSEEAITLVSDNGTANVKLEGTIEECCQKKGCWMKVSVDGMDEPMRVTFKDYGFFVPMNSAGNQVIMEGVVKYDTVDVDVLKHYAEDAGKSQEEIDAITEPEIKLAFEAVGVRIKEKI